MEVVLLWLDDLDDIVFSAALAWERARRTCLALGLAAAFALAGCELSMTATHLVPTLASVAGASVAMWLAGGSFLAVYRKRRPILAAAP